MEASIFERRANPRATGPVSRLSARIGSQAWRSCRRQSTTTMRADVGPGALSGVNVRTQAALMVTVAGQPTTTPTLLPIKYDGQRFSPSLPTVPPGPIVIEVENSGPARGSLLLINWPPEIVAQTIKPHSSSNHTCRAERCCETKLPPSVPIGARRRERRSRHPASNLFVHGPQGFDRHV